MDNSKLAGYTGGETEIFRVQPLSVQCPHRTDEQIFLDFAISHTVTTWLKSRAGIVLESPTKREI